MSRATIAFALATMFWLVIPVIAAGQAPAGWKPVKDSTGVCQIFVPNGWNQSVMIVHSPHVRLKPMSEDTVTHVGADKIFENTTQRFFFVRKPVAMNDGKSFLVNYHVEVPGNGIECIAEINVKQGYSEDEVKKIAATLAPVK